MEVSDRGMRSQQLNGESTRGSRMWRTLAAGLNEYRVLRDRDRGQRQRSDFSRSIQEATLPFLVHGQWLECAARQVQRILIIQSVTHLDRCEEVLLTRLGGPSGRRRTRRTMGLVRGSRRIHDLGQEGD